MARTPLLRALKHSVARHRSITTSSIQDRESTHARGVDRRDFLRYAAAGAAALSLPAFASAKTTPRVVIVGAGIAGLTCALELQRRGVRAPIYEASNRVGGRMFSSRADYWENGQISEWGGELIDTGHQTIRALARRFQLPLDNLVDAEPRGAVETYHFSGQYYPKPAADRDFAKMLAALQADVDAAPLPDTFDAFTSAARALDNMSIRDWIHSRVPGGLDSPLGKLLDVAYTIEYGAETSEQSALNLVYMLGSQPEDAGGALSLFGESDERFHIRGGNERLPKAIAAHLGDDAIRLGMGLRQIQKTAGGAYRLRFEGKGAARDVDADLVVLAIPFAVLRDVDFARADFDARKTRTIREHAMARNAKLQLQFRQRAWTRDGAWPGVGNGSSYTDAGYQSSWEVTRAQPHATGILNFFLGGRRVDALGADTAFATAQQASVTTDAEILLASAEKVFPGLAPLWNRKATLSLWHFNPNTRGSFSYYRVGQYARFFGYEKVRQGGVLFCGEHTSTNFQGFMEGGASEGVRAAAEIARLIGANARAA